MAKPKGKPRGGKRDGSGRPEGSKNALALGEVRAIKAANLRVPDSAPPEMRTLANWALSRIIDAASEKVHSSQAHVVLSAATRLREEACGPLTQKVHVSGLETLTDEQLRARLDAITAKATEPGGIGYTFPCGPDCALRPGHDGPHSSSGVVEPKP